MFTCYRSQLQMESLNTAPVQVCQFAWLSCGLPQTSLPHPWLLRVQCGKKDQRITKNDFAPRLPWRPPHSKAVTNTDQGVKHACRHFIFRLEKLWQLLKELLHGIPSFKKLTTFAPSFIQARWFFLHILSFHLYNEISRFFGTTINWTKPVNLHFYLQKLDRFHDVWFTRTRYQARVVDK